VRIRFRRLQYLFGFIFLLLSPFRTFALDWPSTRLELSSLAGDTEVHGQIPFTNSSSHPVEILEVRPACDCVSAVASATLIPPNIAGSITVTFHPGERLGEQEKTIEVITSDAPATPVRLVVHAHIAEVVSGRPRLVRWQVGDAPKEKTIELVPVGDFKLRSIALPEAIADFSATIDGDPAGKRFLLHLTPRTTNRVATTVLRLTAVVEGRPPLPLTVYALVQSK